MFRMFSKRVKALAMLFFVLPLLCFMVFLAVGGGCVPTPKESRLNKLYEEPAVPNSSTVLRKNHSSKLSPVELEELIVDALYKGLPERYGTVVLTDTKGMAPVVFPHWNHRARYTCQVCHVEFEFSMSGSEISCEDNRIGRHCGVCHNGKIAFSVKDEQPRQCNRCHRDINNPMAMKPIDKRFEEFARGLPKKQFGDGIDWVQAITTGAITPQNSLSGDVISKLPTQHLQEPLRWNTAAPRVNVLFPHEPHIRWLDCSNCHPDIFDVKKLGTVSFDKEKYLSGQFCGSCHMRVAFPINNCSRCHSGVEDWAE